MRVFETKEGTFVEVGFIKKRLFQIITQDRAYEVEFVSKEQMEQLKNEKIK